MLVRAKAATAGSPPAPELARTVSEAAQKNLAEFVVTPKATS